MLTIKRVATVVSNYQEDCSETVEVGCGRNCLGNCCLPVLKLPLYAIKKDREGSTGDNSANSSKEHPQPTCFLHNLLLGEWEDRMNRDLFRYDVTTCETKVIPGEYAFIVQLNEGRHLKKRPTEFRVDQVLQPFDDNKFNFTNKKKCSLGFNEAMTSPAITSPVSPIEYGHVLLIPRLLVRLPQRIDHESFLLALYLAKEAADPFFRLGYNSLGAFATINHLHFQVGTPFYFRLALILRKLQLQELQDRGVMVSELMNFPVRGLVFEGGKSVRDLSNAVASSCIFLQNNNIPFNVLISDSGRRSFLFLQCYAEKQALGEVSQELLDTRVNPAIWEISGHIVLKRKKDYEEASEEYAWRLLAEVSLTEERFQEVKDYVLEASGLQEANMKEKNINQEEDSLEKLRAAHASNLPQDCMV
ncbi:hypothetical protein Pint_18606 [Pistacia integerrima]|uniref:Uncharacterized protein n=1 Tax=Pistacia integerrima TaxID=434235 RepID=A0ACC0YX25_9ROSI|nr:hypothetical protein Pint_18606 [Pistacia integerrima]